MAKKLTKAEAKYWLEEIESCEEKKKALLMGRNAYPELIKYYEGEQFTKDSKKILAIQNEYFPNFNTHRSEVLFQNPDIVCDATKPQADDSMPIMKGALNFAFDKLDILNENKLAFFDMYFAGYSGVEINHVAEKKERPKGFIESVKSKLRPDDVEKKLASEAPGEEELYGQSKSYCKRWNPLEYGFDFRANRTKEIKYVYKIIRKSYAEFVAQYPDYDGKVKADGGAIPYSKHKDDDHRKTVVYYELQVRKENNIYENYVLAPSYPEEEIDFWVRPYITNGFNIKIEVLDDYGVLPPISRAKIAKGNQDDINNYVTHKMEVAERNVPKRGYNKNKVLETEGVVALNSPKVNEAVPCNGGPESVWEIPMTQVSRDNNEMLGILDRTKEKLWGVSQARLQGKSDAQFMGELEIQEAGFQGKRIDLQDGLRRSIRAQLDTLKDIIVQFWDDEYFFKITGGAKPEWYQPVVVPNPATGEPMVMNPLTDILTLDYDIDIDIVSASRPNKERQKKETIEYLTWLFQYVVPIAPTYNKMINFDTIAKTAKDFGMNPESLWTDLSEEQKLLMAQMAQGGEK